MQPRGTWETWRAPDRIGRLLLALTLVLAAGISAPAARAQDELPADRGSVQVVHAVPAIGAVDIYVDGTIVLVGLSFAAVSDPILLVPGDREVRVVPSAASRDEALVITNVTVSSGLTADLALFGSGVDPRLSLFAVDLSPLPPELARLGAVLGSPDSGPVDLAIMGGDLLFPTIDFGEATEFADVAAGTYDFEVRYGGTTSPALSLPGTVLEPGLVYTLYIVGEAAIGELQPLIAARSAESVVLVGHPAWVQTGGCAVEATARVADLVTVAESPFAERSGHPAAAVTQSSFTAIGVPFDSLIEQPHAIAVAESDGMPGVVVACGEIGGTQTVDGSLVVGLRALPGSGTAGIAVLSPNILDPAVTDVSVFTADGLLGGGAPAEPSAAAPTEGGEVAEEPGETVESAPATPEIEN
jgi:hypothetical protein